jgi:lysophospholipase L1-like esterase
MRYIILTITFCYSLNSFSGVINPKQENYNQIIMPSKMGKVKKWRGELKVVNDGYKATPCLLLTGKFAVQQGSYSETNYGRRYCPDGIIDSFYNVGAMVKGSGNIKIGLKSINDSSVKKRNQVRWSALLRLNDKWQNLTLTGQEKNPYCIAHQVLFRFEDSGKVYIDDVKLQYSSPQNIKFSVTPQNIIATPGMEVDIQIKLDKKSPVYIRTYRSTSGSQLVSEIKIDSSKFKLKVPKDISESYRVSISVPELGLTRSLFVSIASKSELNILECEAAKIKLKKPINILVIGDSLSDYYRGFNYINMVDSLLNKFNPGKINIRNVGVGGDFATRVWKRIQGADGKRSAYRQYMFNNYLNPSPDFIFIFLGANDSKCSSTSNFKTPYTTPLVQEKTYRNILDYLRKKTHAKIIIIGCPSFNYKICGNKKKIDKLLKSKRTRWLFGIDAAIMNFNNLNQKIIAEYEDNIDYIDLFKVTRNHHEKEELYQTADGVHFTEKGNRMVALEVLKALGKNNINQ